MKKIFVRIFLISLLLVGCKPEPRIGVIAPLTGEGANYGRSVKEGVELAVDEINSSNQLERPLKVVFEDDKMDPKEGVSAINKLISIDKVPVIIGPFGSSIVLSVAPIAEKNKTVIISASATADQIRDAGDYVFRITPPNSKQGSDIAAFCVNELKCKKAAILYQINDYGQTLKDAFEKKFKELGGIVSISEGVILNSTDLRTPLEKIKVIKPDVVFFPLHYRESGTMLKQAKQIGLATHFISADGAMTEDLLKISGDASEGSYYSTLALGYGIADDQISAFETKFRTRYNKDPDVYAAYYYEVTNLIAYTLKNTAENADSIKQFLYKITGDHSYKGITGITSFDRNGEVDKSFYIYQVKKGKYQLYKK
jgi:branched-chain amino acid transport system substrate-binding protein